MKAIHWLMMSLLLEFSTGAALATSAGTPEAPATRNAAPADPDASAVDILIVYHSPTGRTAQMARAVAEGARETTGVTVRVLPVDDVTTTDLLAAEAVVLGCPVHNANVSVRMQAFINSWPFDGSMRDKLGAAFVTGGGISGGEELVQTSLHHSMLVFGMIVVGGPNWLQPFGASAVTEEDPFKADDPPTGKKLDPLFLRKGRMLGERVAKLALRLHAPRAK